ncbi:MAG: hypothetical protein E3J94_04935 [Desulfobacteraceae bacterium]|nr:MAG: hypothetical protein E3J94_04935 [Desulfobacteraceae bacterium]
MGGIQLMQTTMDIQAGNKAAAKAGAAANKAASYDYQQLTTKRQEIDEAAAQQKFQRQLQTKREHAQIAVATGEAGVGGLSPMKIMQNAIMHGTYDISVIEANRISKARQVIAQKHGVHARAESRVETAKASVTSPTMALLKIGTSTIGAGMQGYMMGSSFKGSTMTTENPVMYT